MTQPYLSHRCWLLHAKAVSAAPAASFKSVIQTSEFHTFVGERLDLAAIETAKEWPPVHRWALATLEGFAMSALESKLCQPTLLILIR